MILTMTARFPAFVFYILIALLAFSAMATLVISTPAGVGLANDSVAYIAGARSILQGKGYSDIWLDSTVEAITHYPPLFSISLAGLGLMGIDPLRGARILNIFLFGANTLLISLIGWRATRSRAAGLWLSALFMLSSSLLRVHIFALSEPLFIFLSLLAFIFIDLYLAEMKNKAWLVSAGLVVGLGFLTRYSALAFLPTFIIALFLFNKNWRARLLTASLFLAGVVPIMAVWFLRNQLIAGNATNRTFQFHPITPENIQPGLYNFSQFLMPFEPWRNIIVKSGLVVWIIAVLGLLLLLWLVGRAWEMVSHPTNDFGQSLTFTTTLYIFCYFGAILFSMSFFDASTKFQPRILAPLYVSFMLLLVSFGSWLWQQAPAYRPATWFGKTIVITLVIASLIFCGYDSSLAVTRFKEAGQGYASWKWHDSIVMASLRDLPLTTAIYTNTPPAVYLVTGRASRVLPSPIDPVDNLKRTDYEQNLAAMRSDLFSGKAVLALFDTSNLEEDPSILDIQTLGTGLMVIQKAQGDILYGKP